MAKKTVFVTGGTGNMGWAAVQEMIKHPNEINIKMLARKSPKNEEKLKGIMAKPNVQVVWGDLGDYDSILEGVTGSDYVLHIGGMVSPTADWKPYRTQKTNIGAAQNICKAVLAQPNADDIKVCYIGTVAETGDRNYPIHWGRCGDPIKISIYDHYAISKTVAERTFVESGIKNWVVMRQSGILYPNILKNMDPIMFHVPINGVLEWCTVEDSGRLMCNLVLEDEKGTLGADFWNHFFNIGSGEQYRISNYEFECLLLGTLGLAGPEKLFDPNWFITKNFHGQFYADGDKLEEFLHFRENLPVKDYFNRLADQVEFYFKIPRYLPKNLVAACAKPFMKKIASTKDFGTLDWVATRNPERLSAYYGTYEDWAKIPTKWEWLQSSSGSADTAVQNSRLLLLLFFSAVTGVLNATSLRSSGITTTSQEQTHSSHKFGILTTLRKKQTFTSLTICSKSTVLSGTILRDNQISKKLRGVRIERSFNLSFHLSNRANIHRNMQNENLCPLRLKPRS